MQKTGQTSRVVTIVFIILFMAVEAFSLAELILYMKNVSATYLTGLNLLPYAAGFLVWLLIFIGACANNRHVCPMIGSIIFLASAALTVWSGFVAFQAMLTVGVQINYLTISSYAAPFINVFRAISWLVIFILSVINFTTYGKTHNKYAKIIVLIAEIFAIVINIAVLGFTVYSMISDMQSYTAYELVANDYRLIVYYLLQPIAAIFCSIAIMGLGFYVGAAKISQLPVSAPTATSADQTAAFIPQPIDYTIPQQPIATPENTPAQPIVYEQPDENFRISQDASDLDAFLIPEDNND